jgi:hypothetical protein
LTTRRKYGRSLKGTKAHRIVRQIRSRNLTVCAAISCGKVINFEISTQPMNSTKFKNYLSGLFDILERMGMNNCMIVMDNCIIHSTE